MVNGRSQSSYALRGLGPKRAKMTAPSSISDLLLRTRRGRIGLALLAVYLVANALFLSVAVGRDQWLRSILTWWRNLSSHDDLSHGLTLSLERDAARYAIRSVEMANVHATQYISSNDTSWLCGHRSKLCRARAGCGPRCERRQQLHPRARVRSCASLCLREPRRRAPTSRLVSSIPRHRMPEFVSTPRLPVPWFVCACRRRTRIRPALRRLAVWYPCKSCSRKRHRRACVKR